MKFICLGYMAETKSEAMSAAELDAALAECFEYDTTLRERGELIGGEVLQSARAAKTVRRRGGKLSIANGPFSASEHQLTGILSLEVATVDEATRLLSRHPSVRMGMCWEIRPAADMAGMASGNHRRRVRPAKTGARS